MAIIKGQGLVGDVSSDNEYQSREDKSAGRPVRQRAGEVTGKRQWKATVTDPDEIKAKRASFDTFRATGFKASASVAKLSRSGGGSGSGEPTAKAA